MANHALQQAEQRMAGNGETHLVAHGSGVEAFNPDVLQQNAPSTPDLNADGNTQTSNDEQFYQELATKYAGQQTQQQETSPLEQEVRQSADIAATVARVEESLAANEATPPVTEPQVEATSEDAAKEISAPDFTEFEAQFEKAYGIPLKDAVSSAQQVQQTYEQLTALGQKLAIQEQRLELAMQWGVSLTEVDQRVDNVRAVYHGLKEETRSTLGDDPVAATMRLFDLLNPGQPKTPPASSNVPTGRATIANDGQQGITPELLAISDDDKFFAELQRMYITPQ